VSTASEAARNAAEWRARAKDCRRHAEELCRSAGEFFEHANTFDVEAEYWQSIVDERERELRDLAAKADGG
jgi:hypothetical protein